MDIVSLELTISVAWIFSLCELCCKTMDFTINLSDVSVKTILAVDLKDITDIIHAL